MHLSAPIYHLKRQAKLLSRKEGIPLHEALDRIAAREGVGSWGLLVTKSAAATLAGKLYARLSPGDLMLVGARPGQGKTLLSLEFAVEAMKCGRHAVFFSLEYAEKDMLACFRVLGVEPGKFDALFEFDDSDDISASHIIRKLATAPLGTLAVVDYLQLLDQRREHPDLMTQIRTLQSFARKRGLIFVFISQIDRSYDPQTKPFPDLGDVRMPNPVDLTVFSKTCFLNNGGVQFRAALTPT